MFYWSQEQSLGFKLFVVMGILGNFAESVKTESDN